jgi:hypothetical protein
LPISHGTVHDSAFGNGLSMSSTNVVKVTPTVQPNPTISQPSRLEKIIVGEHRATRGLGSIHSSRSVTSPRTFGINSPEISKPVLMGKSTSSRSKESAAPPANLLLLLGPFRRLSAVFAWAPWWNKLISMLPIVSSERRESFTRWKMLPPRRVFHHSLHIDLLGLSFLTLVLLEYFLGMLSFAHTIFQSVVIGLIVLRHVAFAVVLQPFRIPLYFFCNICGMLAVVFLVVDSLHEFNHLHDSTYMPRVTTLHNQSTLVTFLSQSHGGVNGLEPLVLLINFPVSMRFHVDLFVFPFGLIAAILLSLKALMTVQISFAQFFYLPSTHAGTLISPAFVLLHYDTDMFGSLSQT